MTHIFWKHIKHEDQVDVPPLMKHTSRTAEPLFFIFFFVPIDNVEIFGFILQLPIGIFFQRIHIRSCNFRSVILFALIVPGHHLIKIIFFFFFFLEMNSVSN